ncbi:MAG: hypothetical protein JRI23_06000 [Deltaproteobacteria bacterium]|jgi:hypothetical protein|nr:hypothetical protein [Deltaproteobacteria bacterium]MBW2531116.1 hypothetical protein [Deltaproteobacteria bacterium]
MSTVVVDPTHPPSRLGRAFLLLLTVGSLSLLLAMPFFGCITEETVECSGGIQIGEKCFPQCESDKCLEGNICVGHLCRLVCQSHQDCDWPRQECRPPAPDQKVSGDPVLVERASQLGVCTDVRFAAAGAFGTPCPYGNECWGTGCPNGLECDVTACMDGAGVPHPEQCVPDPVACNGIEPCNIGTCGEDGPPCVVLTCDAAECTPFFCLGAGEADADAYCTHHDCQADSDCPAGFYCGVTRDPHDICGPTCAGGSCSDDGGDCSSDSDCQKGNSALCGTTTEPCIVPNGTNYKEGGACLLRTTCLKRESCTRCTSQVDCSLDSQMQCSDIGGELVCVKQCSDNDDCFGDETCMPSYATCERSNTIGCGDPVPESLGCPTLPCIGGVCRMADGTFGAPCTTTAECPRENCVPRSVCVPSMGACRGGAGFCNHCVDDTDCGDGQTPGAWACDEVGDGEYACFDFSFPDECPSGADSECPQSPSGAHGECLDSAEGVEPGDSVYHRCYFPYYQDEFTCWP